jgi:hypothetical protein
MSISFFFFGLSLYGKTQEARYAAEVARYQDDKTFAEIARANMSRVNELIEYAGSFTLGSVDPSLAARARIESYQTALQRIKSLVSDTEVSIDEWQNDRVPPREAQPVRFGFSLITSAHAEQYKSRQKREAQNPTLAPAPAPSPPAHGLGKLPAMSPFLWFLLSAPFVAAIGGFACVLSRHSDVRGFGTNVVTSVLGYYFGGGVSLLTVAFL